MLGEVLKPGPPVWGRQQPWVKVGREKHRPNGREHVRTFMEGSSLLTHGGARLLFCRGEWKGKSVKRGHRGKIAQGRGR